MGYGKPRPTFHSLTHVWDVDTLQAVPMRQPSISTDTLHVEISEPLEVDGSVSVDNFPTSQAVTGTFWPTTQPVSGALSVDNFPNLFETSKEPETLRVDYDANGNMIYVGKAMPGASEAVNVWRIQKFTYDAGDNLTSTLWADGDKEYDNVWANRTELDYS